MLYYSYVAICSEVKSLSTEMLLLHLCSYMLRGEKPVYNSYRLRGEKPVYRDATTAAIGSEVKSLATEMLLL